MTYKINVTSVNKISSPIAVRFDEGTMDFSSGKELAEFGFSKNYIVDNISCMNDKLLIALKANDNINETNWFNGKQIDF